MFKQCLLLLLAIAFVKAHHYRYRYHHDHHQEENDSKHDSKQDGGNEDAKHDFQIKDYPEAENKKSLVTKVPVEPLLLFRSELLKSEQNQKKLDELVDKISLEDNAKAKVNENTWLQIGEKKDFKVFNKDKKDKEIFQVSELKQKQKIISEPIETGLLWNKPLDIDPKRIIAYTKNIKNANE